jgi:hypothetical protein
MNKNFKKFAIISLIIAILVLGLYLRFDFDIKDNYLHNNKNFDGKNLDSVEIFNNSLKITKHISFFYKKDRLAYLNKIIDTTNNYDYYTDIYIHTNENFNNNELNYYQNGKIKIVIHDLSNENPFFLTWKCRDLMKSQQNEYDIFIYTEDDIQIPKKTINYWLKNYQKLLNNKYNLGFVRIEKKSNNDEYITDINTKLNKIVTIEKELFILNNNPYCAMWIYDKNEFKKFVNSKYWNLTMVGACYDIREQSAIGLHGKCTDWFKGTLIPIVNKRLIEDCKIYHLPNNYVNNPSTNFGKIKFNDIVNIN